MVKTGIVQVSISKGMDKQAMVWPHIGIWFISKKEWNTDIHKNMDEFQKLIKLKKHTQEYILYEFLSFLRLFIYLEGKEWKKRRRETCARET